MLDLLYHAITYLARFVSVNAQRTTDLFDLRVTRNGSDLSMVS